MHCLPTTSAGLACLGLALLFPSLSAGGRIDGPMVVTDSWPRTSDLSTWADDVLRLEGKSAASDRDKAIALYQWARLFVMSPKAGTEPYEGPFGAEDRLVTDVNKVMFVHGCGDCDYQARALEAVWCAYKKDDLAARRVNLRPQGHTMTELFWDGAWHAFDPLNGVYFLESDAPDANVISFAQEAGNAALVKANEGFANRSRPFFERVRAWTDPKGEWNWHASIAAFFASADDWKAAGYPPSSVFATHSLPSTYPKADMSWHLPRGTSVFRSFSPGADFYVPQAFAASFGPQGRHYRQAQEWGPSTSHWDAAEDPNFPRVAPYLTLCDDPGDLYFYRQHTLYLASAGTMTWQADLWSDAWLDAVEGPTQLVRADRPPYLRPSVAGAGQFVTFRVRSPVIIADADLSAAIAKGASDTAVVSLSVDGGLTFETLATGGGIADVNLGKSRFDGARKSVTGRYDFLVRFEFSAAHTPGTVGLSRLLVTTRIDGSVNALPRLADGANTVRLELADASAALAPIAVEYRWTTAAGERSDRRLIRPGDFSGNEASWPVDATGLTRCDSYAFAYGEPDADANGLPDDWETLFFGAAGQGALDDPDGDGLSNRDEYLAGSVPTDKASYRTLVPEDPALTGTNPSRSGCGCASASASGALLLTGLLLAARRWKRHPS